MMMHKRLQKALAIALMTSFFSTSFIMGVSEAAPARHAGGQRPAQTQQVRPVQKSSSGHQARPHMQQGTHRQQIRPMQKSTGHHGPAIHKSAPNRQDPAIHKNAPQHKGGPIHHGPGMHKGGPIHHGPVVHKHIPHHGGPVVVRHHHPAPPPPPPHHHHDSDYRSMHTGDWVSALVIGGIIGAVIANNSHHQTPSVQHATD